jgi:hypothetical protein
VPYKRGKKSGKVATLAILALAAGCFAPNPTRKPGDLGGEHVSFTSSDGVLLRGHLYGTGSTGVILAHMYPADQSDWTAYQFMRPRVSRIFIAGASLGAEAAIIVAAREDVAGIICISVPTSFGGLVVTESIRHVRAPILFVTSAGDPLVGGQPEILYRSAVAPKSIQIYPGRAHGTAILHGPHSEELQALMLRFIAANQGTVHGASQPSL